MAQYNLNDPINSMPTYDYSFDNPTEYVYEETKLTFDPSYGVTLVDPTDRSLPFIRPTTAKYFTHLRNFISTITASTSGYSLTQFSSGDCIQFSPGFGEELIRFQLSNDYGVKWYYYSEPQDRWTLSVTPCGISGDLLESNPAHELTVPRMEKFHISDATNPQAGDGTSKFIWRAQFLGNPFGIQSYLSHVEVGVTQRYTNATRVKDILKSYNITRLDQFGQPLFMNQNQFLNNGTIDPFLRNADAVINARVQKDFFFHDNIVEFHDGNGKNSLRTYQFPMLKLYYLVMYNPLQSSLRTFLDNEIIADPQKGELWIPPIYPGYLSDKSFLSQFGNIFVPGNRNIEVKYAWGYDQPPDDIATAATFLILIDLIRAFFFGFLSGGQLTSRSVAGYSEGYAPANPMQTPQEQDWRRMVDDILARRARVYMRSI